MLMKVLIKDQQTFPCMPWYHCSKQHCTSGHVH